MDVLNATKLYMLRWSKWPILCDVLFTTIKMFQERATETTRDLRTSARQAGGCAVWSTWTLGCSWQEGAQDGGVTGWGASAGQQVGGRLGDGPRSGRRRRGLRDPMLLSPLGSQTQQACRAASQLVTGHPWTCCRSPVQRGLSERHWARLQAHSWGCLCTPSPISVGRCPFVLQ